MSEEKKTPTLDEQMMRRQSGPRPTVIERIRGLLSGRKKDSSNGAVNAFDVLDQKINAERVREAAAILKKYKEGKTSLENRIVENEKWYKLKHWDYIEKDKKEELKPTSAWLFNSLANKHADAMDVYPSPNFLPREEADKGEAEMLSSVVPVILEQNDFEQTYSDVSTYKLRNGTGVYGVFWDNSKLNGLGDVSVRKIDLLNLFWEPGITDIQRSKNLFHVELADNDDLEGAYPQLKGRLSSDTGEVTKYLYDDTVDTTNKSNVIDWYYKRNVGGKTILHYCKFVNDIVLYATENETQPLTDDMGNVVSLPMSETGLYDHGEYPFVFDTLFSVEGSPAGFGYVDVGKSPQEYTDKLDQAILKNVLANAKPRYFIRKDGSVNETEYADLNNDFIHVDGNLGQDSILPVSPNPLPSLYLEVRNNKIDELKETTGNRDVSTGGTTSGVTAAAAIAAMMESGSKLSRSSNKASYRAFRHVCGLVLELIRQFYDVPRYFRILGPQGTIKFVSYSNANIKLQHQGVEMGQDFGSRRPEFDIEITAQKQSPYSKMAQNELALQFYTAGFFNPALADQALACLEMMDFDRKESIMSRIQQNGMIYQQMMMLQQQMLVSEEQMSNPEGEVKGASETEALGGDAEKESSITKKARQRVAESTNPA